MNANRMHSDSGYIKLYRRITEWRWYADPVMFRVFVHLLLTVNYEDAEWRNMTIKRGQRVTSVPHLAEELGVNRETVRYALKRLTNSGEISRCGNSRYTIITVNNYNEYQENSALITRCLQTDYSQNTGELGTIKEEKEEKEKKEGQESTDGRTENAFSENSFSENTISETAVRENTLPENPKNERIQQNTVSRYSTEKEQELQKSLNERYGKEIVELYEQRFRQWSLKKGAAVPMYQTIEKWLERDGVKPRCEKKMDLYSSFDAEEIDRRILDFYG